MNQKKWFLKVEVKLVRVPYWSELGLEKTWAMAIKVEGFKDLIPNEWDKRPVLRDREFFWTILNTLVPEFVAGLIEDCHSSYLCVWINSNEN